MKKRIGSFLLTLTLCAAMLPVNTLAATSLIKPRPQLPETIQPQLPEPTRPQLPELTAAAPTITRQDSDTTAINGECAFMVIAIGTAPLTYTWYVQLPAAEGAVSGKAKLTGEGVQGNNLYLSDLDETWNGAVIWCEVSNQAGSVVSDPMKLTVEAESVPTDTPAVFVPNCSSWAEPYVQQAYGSELIPDVLMGADLTRSISRVEFAAVAVKIYERLTGEAAPMPEVNPFTDCTNEDALKAYALGITSGTSTTTFSPTTPITREQMAVMLTNTYQRAAHPGWTPQLNSVYTLNYTKPAPFADDGEISSWAKDGVYFMAANKVISGMGNNLFAPKSTSTREQALVMAVHIVNNLEGDVQTQRRQLAAIDQSQSIELWEDLVGYWNTKDGHCFALDMADSNSAYLTENIWGTSFSRGGHVTDLKLIDPNIHQGVVHFMEVAASGGSDAQSAKSVPFVVDWINFFNDGSIRVVLEGETYYAFYAGQFPQEAYDAYLKALNG